MAKKKNKNKIDSETRKCLEAVSDLSKMKNGRYKISNKKNLKSAKKICMHWLFRKGNAHPTVSPDNDEPNKWHCSICHAKFAIRPSSNEEFVADIDKAIEHINQIAFWSVKMGGNADDTKLFIQTRKQLKEIKKAGRNIHKNINKREEYENKAKEVDNGLSHYNFH